MIRRTPTAHLRVAPPPLEAHRPAAHPRHLEGLPVEEEEEDDLLVAVTQMQKKQNDIETATPQEHNRND